MRTFNKNLRNIISESVNHVLENYFGGGYDAFEDDKKEDKKHDDRKADYKTETAKEKERRNQVEEFFKRPGVNIAQYAYRLYNVEAKEGNDTNEMKNARSRFMKCLYHEKNESGYPYSFTSAEINELYSIISSDIQLSEVVKKALNESLEDEMALWDQRENEPFGKVIRKLDTLMKQMFCEPDEYGFSSSPISHYVTAYSLDGDKQYTAKVIYETIENYDMLQELPVKRLVNKMMKLAKEQ